MLLIAALLVTMMPMSVFAGEEHASETIDLATFVKNVEESNYNYDGQGVTVKITPSSACTDTRADGHFNKLCTPDNRLPQPDGNNPQRVQGSTIQYQKFSGVENVSIKNVNFVFESADFSLCMNNIGWMGSPTVNEASSIRAAELQLQNTGDVIFDGCSFNGVIVSPFSSRGNLNVTDSTFKNIDNTYAVKDIYSKNAVITNNEFENCSGGIYFEGDVPKEEYIISGNRFINISERGMIQFSKAGDYSEAKVTIAGNTSTGSGAAIRQLNSTLKQNILDLGKIKEENVFEGELLTDNTYSGENTVYYNGTTYKTLAEALNAVYKSEPNQTLVSTAAVFCKKSADVGAMTHGHVADDIVIYGNGAKVTGGERDLEIDTYKYDRTTGNQSEKGVYLDQNITVNVYDLDGIAAWGQRNTEHTVNLNFYNCKNMQRVYFTGITGVNNIALEGCSFDGSETANPKSNKDTSIYSNAPGSITMESTTFTNIDVPINLNNKSTGTQTVKVVNSTFNDCGIGTESNKTYAAPVRIVAQKDATTNLIVENAGFNYSEGKQNCGNGDILIGDGRYNASETQGKITLSMKETAANVMFQEKGYYKTEKGDEKDPSKSKTQEVGKNDVIEPEEEGKPTPTPPIVTTYYDITAVQTEHGKISLSTDRIHRGGNVEVTLTADEGYEVKGLLINGKSVGAVSSYTIKSVSEDIQVTAVFGETEAAKNDRIAKGVQNTTIKMYYKKGEIGKGWIKLRYKKSYGYKVDNYEIFRSAKKKTNFGEKACFVTKTNKTSGYYKNEKSVKKGTRYYYKMRGVREIAGETYYTQWSNVVMRTGR